MILNNLNRRDSRREKIKTIIVVIKTQLTES